jgi:hypothetical protein
VWAWGTDCMSDCGSATARPPRLQQPVVCRGVVAGSCGCSPCRLPALRIASCCVPGDARCTRAPAASWVP